MTTTQQTSLAAWIAARLDEDEAAALAANGPGWRAVDSSDVGETFVMLAADNAPHGVADCDFPADGTHIARHDPTRVLAQVAALRRVVAKCAEVEANPDWWGEHDMAGYAELCEDTLRNVAAIWADVEGYDEAVAG